MAIDLNALNSMHTPQMAILAVQCGVGKHQAVLVDKINMLCLRIGLLNKNSPQEASAFRDQLTQEINRIASDENEKSLLFKYTDKVIRLALNQLK